MQEIATYVKFCPTLRLSVRSNRFNAVRGDKETSRGDHEDVLSIGLVGSKDRDVLPLGPVDELVLDGDGEGMVHAVQCGLKQPTIGAVQVRVFYLVQVCVGPVEPVFGVVDGDAVGPD